MDVGDKPLRGGVVSVKVSRARPITPSRCPLVSVGEEGARVYPPMPEHSWL